MNHHTNQLHPSTSFAFVAASWAALLAGVCAYLLGLWNAGMQLNEKGYYFTVLAYGLFAAVSLQRACATVSKAFRSRGCTTASRGRR